MLTSTRNQLLTQAMVDEVPRLEDRNRRLAEAMEDRQSECQRDALPGLGSMEIRCTGPT
jgi:hypothetical protein